VFFKVWLLGLFLIFIFMIYYLLWSIKVTYFSFLSYLFYAWREIISFPFFTIVSFFILKFRFFCTIWFGFSVCILLYQNIFSILFFPFVLFSSASFALAIIQFSFKVLHFPFFNCFHSFYHFLYSLFYNYFVLFYF